MNRCPIKPFLILSTRRIGAAEEAASWLWDMYNNSPCVLCSFWRNHVAKYPSLQSLLPPASKAEISLAAEAAEVENTSVECGNAAIRRQVKGFQARLKQISDISSCWVSSEERRIHESNWGDELSDVENNAEESGPGKKKKRTSAKIQKHARGGGVCRSFVSYFAKTMRKPNGRPDFTEIMKQWHLQKEKIQADGPTAFFESLKEESRLATLARRQQEQAGLRGHCSSFGVPKESAVKKEQRRKDAQKCLATFMGPSHAASNTAGAPAAHAAGHAESPDSQLQIVPAGTADFQTQQLAIISGSDNINSQVAVLKSALRTASKDKQQAIVQENMHFKSAITSADTKICGISPTELVTDAKLRSVTCRSTTYCHVQDHIINHCSQKVKQISKERPDVLDRIFELWDKEHELIKEDENNEVGHIPDNVKPSICQLAGRCVCSGRGLVLAVASRQLAQGICSLGIRKGIQV